MNAVEKQIVIESVSTFMKSGFSYELSINATACHCMIPQNEVKEIFLNQLRKDRDAAIQEWKNCFSV